MNKGEIAVIDTDGMSSSVIKAAKDRGIIIYGYLNAGALEKTRFYYKTYQDLILANYQGWAGEYWVDVTNDRWKDHLLQEARTIKAVGATGVYFDNIDIYYMVEEGFRGRVANAPSPDAVYKALSDVMKKIQDEIGLTLLPNCGETFLERFIQGNTGFLKEVNVESVLYGDNGALPKGETNERAAFLDKWKKKGIKIRGIEYINTQAGTQKVLSFYEEHGWDSVYISRHYTLEGD